MKPQRSKKSARRPGLAAEPLESRCLLSAAPAPLLSFAPDGAAWMTSPTTLIRLAAGTATSYALPASSNSTAWTITSAAVFTADNSAWFLLSNGQTNAVERLAPDGHFVTAVQQPALQNLAAAGDDVWFTQGSSKIGLITTTGKEALFPIPGIAQFTQLAAVIPAGGGTDAALFAGQSTDGASIVGSVTVNGEIHIQTLAVGPAFLVTTTSFSVGPATAFVMNVVDNGWTDATSADDPPPVVSLGTTAFAVTASPSKNAPHVTPSHPLLAGARPITASPATPPQASDAAGTLSAKAAATSLVFEGEFSIVASSSMPLRAEPSPQSMDDDTASSAPVKTKQPFAKALASAAQHVALASQAPAQQFSAQSAPITVAPLQNSQPAAAPPVFLAAPPAEPLTPRVLPKWTLLAMTIFAGRQESLSAKIQERKRRISR